jgi:flagellar biosynthesis protein FlhB
VFTKWSKTKKITAVVAAVALVLIAFFVVVIVDGEAYDRWRHANHLRMLQQAWL